MTIGTNLLIKYTDQTYLVEHDILTAPCNLYQALASIINQVGASNKWKIVIEPSETEYFLGE
jgi:hypothetical protein